MPRLGLGSPPPRERPLALLVVRNTFRRDARVLRAARTLRGLGLDVAVLAALSQTERERHGEEGGVPVTRLGPSSRFAVWLYSRVVARDRPRHDRESATAEGVAPRAPGEAATGTAGGVVGDAAGAAVALRPRATPAPAARRLAVRLARWAATIDWYRRGIAAVTARRPDLVQCNDYNTMWIGVAARVLCGSAVIYDSHELWPDRNLRPEPRWWLILCEALFVRVADALVMSSPGHADVVARRYRVAAPTVVRNIPELTASDDAIPAPPAPPRPGADRTAVYVGGLQPNRGLEQSIRALTRVERVRLRLIGPPLPIAYAEELEALVDSLGLRERVDFSGMVAPDRVVAELAGADAGLCLFQPTSLSHRLVLPNKLFEYAAAGVPVLGSDLPMVTGFVDRYECGVTVNSSDPAAIAGGLEEVLDHDAGERYRAGARRAAADARWDRERELLAGVYRAALARRGVPASASSPRSRGFSSSARR